MELVKRNDDNKLITELRTVCEVFNKTHRHVMRDIHNIINDLPRLSCEFIPQTYKDVNNRTQNTYYLTEKGFYILTSSFKGKKAREFQSKFFNEFKRLQEENTLLKSTLVDALKSGRISLKNFDVNTIVDEFKRLQEENTLLTQINYQTEHTYCISDIVQKFKDLTPWDAQHELYLAEWLEWRQSGMFPNEFYDNDNSIVSVYDYKRGKYYPRYTLKGCQRVEQFLIEKGYELK